MPSPDVAGCLLLGGIVAWKKVKELAIKGSAFVDRLNVTMDNIDAGLARGADTAKTVEAIHGIQGVQAENHLLTIQETNKDIKAEAMKQTSLLQDMKIGQACMEAKFDTLIGVMRDKA